MEATCALRKSESAAEVQTEPGTEVAKWSLAIARNSAQAGPAGTSIDSEELYVFHTASSRYVKLLAGSCAAKSKKQHAQARMVLGPMDCTYLSTQSGQFLRNHAGTGHCDK